MRTPLLALVSCVIHLYAEGTDFTVECDPRLVEAVDSKDATLSCKVKFTNGSVVDLTDEFVKWHVTGEANTVLYIWRSGEEDLKHQAERFKGRIRIDKDDLKKGNIMITFSDITPEDQGKYTCSVTLDISNTKVSNVQLNVRNESSSDKDQVRNTATTSDFPWWAGLLLLPLAIGVIVVIGGIIALVLWKKYSPDTFLLLLERLRCAPRNGQDGQAADMQLQTHPQTHPQNDDIIEQQQHLLQDNAANGQPQEDGN